MVAVVVDRIASISVVLPDLVGEELVLRCLGPVVIAAGMAMMLALDLLQEHDVGADFAQAIAQFVHHHVPVKLRKAFVNIVGEDAQFHARHDRRRSQVSSHGLFAGI